MRLAQLPVPLIPLTPADQHLVGGWLVGECEAEQALEGGSRRVAAVEAKGELVEVGLEMLPAQAVVDAQAPALRVGEDAVDPRQHDVRGHGPDHLGVVLDVLERGVAGPAVAHHRAADGNRSLDEAAQALDRVVLDHRQSDPAWSLALDFDRTRDQELALVRPAGLGRDRFVLGAPASRPVSPRSRQRT